MDERKKYLLEESTIPAAVLTMIVPTTISSLIMIFYNLADTYFVGMLNDPVQNAAVALSAPMLLGFNAINNLFGVGGSSMMSRSMGKGDRAAFEKSSVVSFYGAVFGGVLFSLAYLFLRPQVLFLLGATQQTAAATERYLFWTVGIGAVPAILNVVIAYMVRAQGAPVQASVGVMSGCLLNIVLDPIFILPSGLGMGASGAGLATCISNGIACVYFLLLIRMRSEKVYVCVDVRKLRFEKAVLGEIFAVGIPASMQNLLNVTGMTVLNQFTAAYGANAVAAMGIAQKVHNFPVSIFNGISQGVMPLIGYNYAKGDHKRMKAVILFAGCLVLAVTVMAAGVFLLIPDKIMGGFISHSDVISIGEKLLRRFSVAIPFLCIDYLIVAIFQAVGEGRYALVFAVLRKIVLEIPALYVWNHFYPLYGLAYAQATAEVILATIGSAAMIRFFARKQKTSSSV